ncbi:hypothetical protein HK096_006385, partial [Nowakowskiella sp. JEL0078]
MTEYTKQLPAVPTTSNGEIPPSLPPPYSDDINNISDIPTVSPQRFIRPEEVINASFTTLKRAYGPNTANPFLPQSFKISSSFSSFLLDLSHVSIEVPINISINVKVKMSSVFIFLPEGVLLNNSISPVMGSVDDDRIDFTLPPNHHTITLTGSVTMGSLNIIDDLKQLKGFRDGETLKNDMSCIDGYEPDHRFALVEKNLEKHVVVSREVNSMLDIIQPIASHDLSGWDIENVGIPNFKNPLPCVGFVMDSERILMNPRTSAIGGRQGTPLNNKSAASQPIPSSVSVEKAGPREYILRDPSTVKVGIVTCGGICPALNNVIRSLVNCLWYRYNVNHIIGFKYGYEGLNPDKSEIMHLDPRIVRDIHQFGGSILGSSRGPQNPKIMVDYLEELGVNILFTIGGDGTQKGAQSICEEVKRRNIDINVVGIPKTVDNDISYVERTFGFETAVELAQPAIKAAHEEARSAKNGIGIVKLMGRESGFISLHAALASGDVNLLLLPEMKFTMDGIVKYVAERFKYRRHCVIVVSEGAGQEICASKDGLGVDASGNVKFADIGVFLKDELGKRLKSLGIENTI